MKAMVLHDETGKILSIVVTASGIDLELLPDREESVLEVDASELGIDDVGDLSPQTSERVRASVARTKQSMRVDVKARRLVRS